MPKSVSLASLLPPKGKTSAPRCPISIPRLKAAAAANMPHLSSGEVGLRLLTRNGKFSGASFSAWRKRWSSNLILSTPIQPVYRSAAGLVKDWMFRRFRADNLNALDCFTEDFTKSASGFCDSDFIRKYSIFQRKVSLMQMQTAAPAARTLRGRCFECVDLCSSWIS